MEKLRKRYLKKVVIRLNIVFLLFCLLMTTSLPIVLGTELDSNPLPPIDETEGSSETIETESSTSTTTTEEETSSSSTTTESSTSTSSTQQSGSTSSSSQQSSEKEDSKKEEKKEPEVYEYVPTKTTQDFISLIGEDARKIAYENDLYASVMIAQAILESGSGNSKLARNPNFNLFGIKGKYQGKSVSMDTLEDDGVGKFFNIVAEFRKYPSYKESLEDYASLLVGKTGDLSSTFYYGARRRYADTYKDATKFLTGRYATDTSYDKKLNGLIEAYDLTKYDSLNPEEESQQQKERREAMIRKIAQGDTLWDISKENSIDLPILVKSNRLSDSLVHEGQELLIPSEEEEEHDTAELDTVSDDINKVSRVQTVQDTTLRVGQRIIQSLKLELEKNDE